MNAMNMNIQLTDRERALIRKDVFMTNRADADFVLQALQESGNWHKPYLAGDAVELARAMDKAVLDYCEACDLFADAERELLSSKAPINNIRHLAV